MLLGGAFRGAPRELFVSGEQCLDQACVCARGRAAGYALWAGRKIGVLRRPITGNAELRAALLQAGELGWMAVRLLAAGFRQTKRPSHPSSEPSNNLLQQCWPGVRFMQDSVCLMLSMPLCEALCHRGSKQNPSSVRTRRLFEPEPSTAQIFDA